MRKLLAALCSLLMLAAIGSLSVPSAEAFGGFVNDTGVRVRAAPSLSAPILKTLQLGQEVDVVATASGSSVDGNGTWYQLPSGGWVHSSFISQGSASSGAGFAGRWVDVDISTQTARAMQGNTVVYTAPVTTGKPGWETPRGTFRIISRPGTVNMRGADYYQPNVQYTQYFNNLGDALHANYWQPASVFGNVPTSHGCVGMRTAEAAFFWNFGFIGMPVVIHD
jgi:hypothetical protein